MLITSLASSWSQWLGMGDPRDVAAHRNTSGPM